MDANPPDKCQRSQFDALERILVILLEMAIVTILRDYLLTEQGVRVTQASSVVLGIALGLLLPGLVATMLLAGLHQVEGSFSLAEQLQQHARVDAVVW